MKKKVSILISVVFLIVLGAIYFSNRKEYQFNVYYNNSVANPNSLNCSLVFPVERTAGLKPELKTVLENLFTGPTKEEKERGYTSLFNEDTKEILRKVKIQNNIAYVDFIDIRSLIPSASASCGSTQFMAEIEKTIKDFVPVDKVIFAINGEPAAFYEWVQAGCDPKDNYCNNEPFK